MTTTSYVIQALGHLVRLLVKREPWEIQCVRVELGRLADLALATANARKRPGSKARHLLFAYTYKSLALALDKHAGVPPLPGPSKPNPRRGRPGPRKPAPSARALIRRG